MATEPASLVITNGTVVDGTGGSPVQGGTVVVHQDRVVAVGRQEEISWPSEATVIDAGGGTILPGIVDSHVQSASDPAVRREMLACGVTSACDLGSPRSTMSQFAEDRIDHQLVARGFRAGPMLAAPGGLPDALVYGATVSVLVQVCERLAPGLADSISNRRLLSKATRYLSRRAKSRSARHTGLNYEVASAREARSAVADLVSRGADVIKVMLHERANGQIYPILSEEQVQAIVHAAHAHGVLVRAHVWEISLADIALAGGVDAIEHVPKLTVSAEEMAGFLKSSDPLAAAQQVLASQVAARDQRLQQMIDRGIVLVPTVERVRWGLEHSPTLKPEADLLVALDVAGVRRFHDLGGIVALGTDYNSGLDEGEMVLRELAFFVQAGLTPMEAIQAATRHAARVSGYGDELGTLEPGKLADLIVVDGDPLQDIRAIGNLRTAIVGGEVAYTDGKSNQRKGLQS